MTLDDEKLALLAEAADHAGPEGARETDDGVTAGRLVRPYYRNVAAEDITERPDADQPESAIVGVTTRTVAVPCGREAASSRWEVRAPNRSSGERSATSSGATWR